MKAYTNIIFWVVVGIGGAFLIGCDGDETLNCNQGIRIGKIRDVESEKEIKDDILVSGRKTEFYFEYNFTDTHPNPADANLDYWTENDQSFVGHWTGATNDDAITKNGSCIASYLTWDGNLSNLYGRRYPMEPGTYRFAIRVQPDNCTFGTGVCENKKIIQITTPAWDRDGDNISDAVEDENQETTEIFFFDDQNNSTTYYYHKDDNEYPPRIASLSSTNHWYANSETHDYSLASNIPATDQSNGSLINGLKIAHHSTGYYYWWNLATDKDNDNWGTVTMINLIEKVARKWNQTHADYPLTTLDISLKHGGKFTPHNSHQKGISLDIYYVGTGTYNISNLGNNKVEITDTDVYDPELNYELMQLFITYGSVSKIFTSDDMLYNLMPDDAIEYRTGHADHFHVELHEPDIENN